MRELSGPIWCTRFPGSKSVDDLDPAFRPKAVAFISALTAARARCPIEATLRPAPRAYLMHFACLIAGYRDGAGIFHQMNPVDVPPMQGVDIDWTHGGDLGAARAAAVAMKQGYNIAFPAALVSRHTQGRALDMTIGWDGTLSIRDFNGQMHSIDGPRDGSNPLLQAVGKSYGVVKLPSDPPHWSDDGH